MCSFFITIMTRCVYSRQTLISSKYFIHLWLYGATPTEEIQPWRINTVIRCTITTPSCDHLLFMSQQNVMIGLSGATICLIGEAYTRSKIQLYSHCQYSEWNAVCINPLSVFRAALFGPFRSWLGEVLGVELEPTVDISCARYEYTGEICHVLGSFGQFFWWFDDSQQLSRSLSRCSFVSWWWVGGETRCFHSVPRASMAEQWWGNPRPLLNRQWVSCLVCVVCAFRQQKSYMFFIFR